MSKKTEQVFVVRNDHGIHLGHDDYFAIQLDGSESWQHELLSGSAFVDRWMAEQDSTILQLIPYVICMAPDGKVLSYQRKGGGEGRLEGKHSIGIGGHVNKDDMVVDTHGNYTWSTVLNGAIREIVEEVDITASYARANLREVGVVYVPSDDGGNTAGPGPNVGEVHLGIVYVLPVEDDLTINDDEGMIKPKFVTDKGDRKKYEQWSKFVLDNLDLIVEALKTTRPK
jgi:predicted NUDIX family phosphoesterase